MNKFERGFGARRVFHTLPFASCRFWLIQDFLQKDAFFAALLVEQDERLAFGKTDQRQSSRSGNGERYADGVSRSVFRDHPRIRGAPIHTKNDAAVYCRDMRGDITLEHHARRIDFSLQDRRERVFCSAATGTHEFKGGEIPVGKGAGLV